MLGPKIEQRMLELGIKSQTDLAEKAGLSVQYVNGIIRGNRGKRLSHTTAKALAKALRVRPIFFDMDSANAQKEQRNNATADTQADVGCRI